MDSTDAFTAVAMPCKPGLALWPNVTGPSSVVVGRCHADLDFCPSLFGINSGVKLTHAKRACRSLL